MMTEDAQETNILSAQAPCLNHITELSTPPHTTLDLSISAEYQVSTIIALFRHAQLGLLICERQPLLPR